MIIIGITGTLGAGKGTIVEYLEERKGFTHFSVRAYLLEEIRRLGLPENRDSMVLVANELRSIHGPSYVTDQLYFKAAQIGKNCIIESIRTPGEVLSLRAKGNFYLFAVDALPETPVITITGDSLMSSSSAGNQWYRDGSPITTATGQYLAVTVPGYYQVQVTGPSGCVSRMSDPFVYVGISHVIDENRASVYPNPTNGIFRISASGLEERTFEVRIYNSLGQLALSAKNTFTFDLSALNGGIYYLSVVTDRAESFSKKIILIKS